MLTLAGAGDENVWGCHESDVQKPLEVFMRLDRGKIILNKKGKVIFISKKAPGKIHLHDEKSYPRSNSSPDIMGITGKFEPCFQT